jgi:hydroxylamine reductase
MRAYRSSFSLARRSFSNAAMACFQCEQTASPVQGCTTIGNCGKTPEVSRLQDALSNALIGISQFTSRSAALGVTDPAIDAFSIDSMFSTLTNVNFDDARFVQLLKQVFFPLSFFSFLLCSTWFIQADANIVKAKSLYEKACEAKKIQPEKLSGPAAWRMKSSNVSELIEQARAQGDLIDRKQRLGEDVAGIQSMILFGLRGCMAYADHARLLGRESEAVYGGLIKKRRISFSVCLGLTVCLGIRDSLRFLGDNDVKNSASVDRMVQELLKVGETTINTLALLDDANTSAFGTPTPTVVATAPLKGKAILISGHDLADLVELLKQTEGTGINVYTHGEMLPAHGYPLLKKFKHLAGNYGGAW